MPQSRSPSPTPSMSYGSYRPSSPSISNTSGYRRPSSPANNSYTSPTSYRRSNSPSIPSNGYRRSPSPSQSSSNLGSYGRVRNLSLSQPKQGTYGRSASPSIEDGAQTFKAPIIVAPKPGYGRQPLSSIQWDIKGPITPQKLTFEQAIAVVRDYGKSAPSMVCIDSHS